MRTVTLQQDFSFENFGTRFKNHQLYILYSISWFKQNKIIVNADKFQAIAT